MWADGQHEVAEALNTCCTQCGSHEQLLGRCRSEEGLGEEGGRCQAQYQEGRWRAGGAGACGHMRALEWRTTGPRRGQAALLQGVEVEGAGGGASGGRGEEPWPILREGSPGASPGLVSALHSLAPPGVPITWSPWGRVRSGEQGQPHPPTPPKESTTCPQAYVYRRPGHLWGEHTHTHKSLRPGTQTETHMQIHTH